MVVRADASQAAGAGDQLESSLRGVASAEREAASAASGLGSATDKVEQSQRRGGASAADNARQMRANADALNQVVRATNPAVSSQAQLDTAVRRVQSAFIAGKVGAEVYARAQEIAARATRENVQWQQRAAASAGQMRAGSMMLGQQIQDVGMQLALGTDFMRVFAMQAGQTALAVQQMTGGSNRFATFIGGPWGSLILAGVSILALFVSGLNDATEASEQAQEATDGLGRAQSALGELFDMTTGKILDQSGALREHIALLRLNAQLQAINLRAEAANQRETASTIQGEIYDTAPVSPLRALRAGGGGDLMEQNRLLEAIRTARTPEARAAARSAALQASERQGFGERGGVGARRFREAVVAAAQAEANDAIAANIDQALASSQLPEGLRHRPRGGGRGRQRRQRQGPDLAEIGRDQADRLSTITGRFADQPRLIEQVRAALAEVDDVMREVERRKPPNYNALVEQARLARDTIREAADRPFRQLLENQQQQLAVQRLITRGRQDEADALQIIQRLEQTMGPITQERKNAILAGVQALRQEERQLEINRQKQEKYLAALGDVRSIIVDTIEAGFRNIADIPRRLMASFNRLSAEYIFEKLFGNTFRRLQSQIRGENTAERAAERFGQAVDTATASTSQASTALDDLTSAANRAATAIDNRPAGMEAPAFWPAPSGGQLPTTGIFAADWGEQLARAIWNASPDDQQVTVTGSRPFRLGGGIPTNPRDFFGSILGQLAEGILGKDASAVIGKVVGHGLEGAFVGQAVGGLVKLAGNALGFKTSNTGAMIGGAIGSALPIPGGEIIGSILGSIAGGFLKSTPRASVTLTNAFDDFSATGSRSLRGAATGAGSSVQAGLQNIAEQLGGNLGDFSVSIGVRDGKYRVDPTGRGVTKTSKGAVDFGEDQQAAVMFAIMDAIKDGAIKGLSSAVTKALSSSTDLDRALREAMRVQELEDLIGGLGGKLSRQFKDFDRVAEERVRLAKKYGLDLLAVEKINAEERAKLVETITNDRIGSALQFLKDLKFGDLFEGDAQTRRSLILDEIAATQQEAEAGIDGAADRLVDLYRRLIDTSHEAFGTAGPELTSDRDAAKTGIERVIELENKRIAEAQAAQQATTDAITQGNVLASETNDLLAVLNGRVDTLVSLASGSGSAWASGSGGGALPSSILDLVRQTGIKPS